MEAYQFGKKLYQVTCSHCRETYYVSKGTDEFRCKKNSDKITKITGWVDKKHERNAQDMDAYEFYRSHHGELETKKRNAYYINHYENGKRIKTYKNVREASDILGVDYHKLRMSLLSEDVEEKFGLDLRR